MRPVDRDMEEQYGKIRYSSLSLVQEVLFCFINIFLSFPEFFKRIFLHLLCSNESQRSTLVYPSLQTVGIPPSCITDIHQAPSSEPYDVHDHSCELNETKAELVPSVLNPAPSKIQERYSPLKLPSILHDFPLKHYKYLPRFDGELDGHSAEKHIQVFEHFIDLFEIEHDDVSMRAFSQSLQGDAKAWFKHLQPQSISSWDELREAFRRFWGERKSWNLLLSEFYAMRRMKDETISNFSRRFASLYYKLPKEVQPPEVVAMLHYVTTFQSDLSFLLMERKSMSLQQMFNNAQEVEDNLQACQRPQNQNLKSVANTENDGVAEEHEIVHKQEADLHPDLFQHEQKIDCFMHFFEVFNNDIVAEDKDQPTEEQVDVPRFFLVDDIADVVDLPKYDEYNDNYEIDFSEQPTACSPSGSVQFQQFKERSQPACFSCDNDEEHEESIESGEITFPLCFSSFKLLKKNVYNVSNQKSSRHDVEYEESSGLANENYLPLCFSSFELLKVNHEITEEAGKSDCIHSDTVLHEQIVINEEDQQPSHTFNDRVVDYMEGYFSSDLQPVINYQLGNKDDGQSTSVLDMDCLPPEVSFQPTLSSDSEDCYFQQSQQIFQPLWGNQQVELHENKDAVEGVKHDCCFMHVLEDPFAVLLEAVNNPNVFNFLRFEFIDKFLNELSVNKLWSKHVQRKKTMDKVLAWLHWHFDFT
jgi:hypothetical protein